MSRKNKPSPRQLEANRRNALNSTGPRTVEGKARSAQNAATHALSNPLSKAHFLHTEDEHQYNLLLSEYIATYQPRHRDEYDLLNEAVYAKWRQQRIWLAETAQIEIAIARNEPNLQKELPSADAAAHLANGIAHSENLMRLYLRYGAQLHRQYLRCLRELRDLQAQRRPPIDSPNEPTQPTTSEVPSEPIPIAAPKNDSPRQPDNVLQAESPTRNDLPSTRPGRISILSEPLGQWSMRRAGNLTASNAQIQPTETDSHGVRRGHNTPAYYG